MYLALKIAKQGYFGGCPMTVLERPVNIIIQTLLFMIEEDKLEATIMELNK